ncbi:MAG TPA: UDP-N-acetylmuramyl peptide synthase, partial [Treponema sp.]|nr:UDP-N-acetylmuramyl peptide synthase [Treponema sp.]
RAEDGISSPNNTDACIEGLAFDSRDVKENYLFFALPGTHTTGNKFIAQAVSCGASAVIFQDEITQEEQSQIKAA